MGDRYPPHPSVISAAPSSAEEVARLEAELAALRASEQGLRCVLDASPIAIVLVDRKGCIQFLNASTEQLFGYSREELLNECIEILIPNQFREKHPGLRDSYFVSPSARQMGIGRDLYGQHRNGTLIPVEIGLNPLRTDQGFQVIAAIADISERKRAESTRAHLAAIVDSADDAIISKDLNGIITSWNSGAERLLGYRADEINLQNVMLLVPKELEGQEEEIMVRIRNGDRIAHLETIRRHKNGHTVEVSASISPVKNAAGAVTGAATIYRDVSERNRITEQIRQLHADREQRVAERAAELEATNRELEAFSYSVSHDLRSPLRAIDGFSRILLRDYGQSLPTKAQTLLNSIRDNTQRMGGLIADLLSFSRLSRQALNKQMVDNVALVKLCVEELRFERAGRRIVFEFGQLPLCYADPVLLKQVWTNLISNAIKYTTHASDAAIQISGEIAASSREIVFSVRDNGVGFDMRFADKLFGVFQRLHRSEDYPGTGVGLAIVQRIIHRHGGRVAAESQTGKGALFVFAIPMQSIEHE